MFTLSNQEKMIEGSGHQTSADYVTPLGTVPPSKSRPNCGTYTKPSAKHSREKAARVHVLSDVADNPAFVH